MKKILILVALMFFALPVYSAEIPDNKASETCVIVDEAQNPAEMSEEYKSYMKNLRKSIKKNWNPPRGDNSKSTVLLFKLSKDGQLSDCKVNQSSGDEVFDKSAVEAVEKAAPFAPLPEIAPEYTDVLFTFDYKVFAGQMAAPSSLVFKSTPNSPVRLLWKNMKNKEDKKVFKAYLEQVAKVLIYVQYDGKNKNLVRIKFTINKEGNVIFAKVSGSTGDKDFNNQILSKVKTLEFGEIPEQLKLNEITFEIEFNNCFYYNPLTTQNYAKTYTAFNAVTASSALGLFIMSIIGF